MTKRLMLAGMLAVVVMGAAPAAAHDDYRIIGTITKLAVKTLDVKQTKDGKTISMRTDEAVAAAPLPDHIVMAAAAIGKRHHLLDRVAHDVVVAIGLAIGGVNLDAGGVVIAQMAKAAADPDPVGPARDVFARIAIGRIGRRIQTGELIVHGMCPCPVVA